MITHPFDKRSTRILVITTAVFFAVACAVRIVLAWYGKTIDVGPDEIRYLNLAGSLTSGNGLIERGGQSGFQKILYPLSLAPAFVFPNALDRVHAIEVLNSIYLCSSVFPALVLSMRLFDKKAPVIACVAAVIIAPDLAYSMTFMSECIFIPLALWLIVSCWEALEERGARHVTWSFASGVLCYLVYLAKEVAFGFALAFLLISLIRMIMYKDEWKNRALGIVAFLVGFGVPFVIMKATLFSGLYNSYSQSGIDVLANPYTVLFALYALAADTTHFVVGLAFFPLALPLFVWPRLTNKEKTLYLFCAASFAFILLAVVYTISIREDLGHMNIRPHLRYVAPLYFPLLYLFLASVLRNDGEVFLVRPRRRRAFIACGIAACLFTTFLFGNADVSQGFDYSQYHTLRAAQKASEPLPVDPENDPSASSATGRSYEEAWVEIDPAIWGAKALVVAFIMGGTLVLAGRHRRKGGIAVMAVIAAAMLSNNYFAWQYNANAYDVEQDGIDEIVEIDSYLAQLPSDATVLIVLDDTMTERNNLIDTYVYNKRLSYHYIKHETLVANEKPDHTLDQATILERCDNTVGDNVNHAEGRTSKGKTSVDYVLIRTGRFTDFRNAVLENTDVGSDKNFILYRVTQQPKIDLESLQDKVDSQEETITPSQAI